MVEYTVTVGYIQFTIGLIAILFVTGVFGLIFSYESKREIEHESAAGIAIMLAALVVIGSYICAGLPLVTGLLKILHPEVYA